MESMVYEPLTDYKNHFDISQAKDHIFQADLAGIGLEIIGIVIVKEPFVHQKAEIFIFCSI